jgi:hypothetical protein
MQSPLFPFRQKALGPIFSSGVIRTLWKKKIWTGMRKHHLADPIDNLDFHYNIVAESASLEALIKSGSYTPRETKRILAEKSRGLCRQIVIPRVRDAIVLQCLSDALYQDVRGKEPTKQAFFEPEDHKFSKSDDIFKTPEYGSFKAWLSFQQELFRFSKEYDYVVITDIANYYDTISYSHLRNIISDLGIDVREPVLDMLIYVLSGLLWQPDYMPRVEIGLPQINTDAPRILAHCFLYELDKFLDSTCGGDFARYMDDVDVGTDSVQEAKRILKQIDLVLHTRQVRLNSGKTLILSKVEAAKYYRTRDNRFLNAVERHIDRKVKSKLSLARERKFLVEALSKSYPSGRFNDGNGEKILKRIVKVASKIGAEIDDKLAYELALKRPALRDPIARLFSQLPASVGRIQALHQLISGGHLVDDASYIIIANSLVETQVDKIFPCGKAIRLLMKDYPENTSFQIYGKILLESKYGKDTTLLALLSKHQNVWRTDHWLGRLVGAMYPRFIASKLEPDFRQLVKMNVCDAAWQTYDFHEAIRIDPAEFLKVHSYVKAGNKTKRIGTTHARFLLAVSAAANAGADPAKVQSALGGLGRAWDDVFYSSIAKGAFTAPLPAAPGAPFPYP